jgi:hypothetical protein
LWPDADFPLQPKLDGSKCQIVHKLDMTRNGKELQY